MVLIHVHSCLSIQLKLSYIPAFSNAREHITKRTSQGEARFFPGLCLRSFDQQMPLTAQAAE
jgi:hypothetical protein